MSTSHFIVLIETDPAFTETLATRLVRIGIEPIRVANLDEAVEVVESRQYAFCGVLVPAETGGKQVGKALKAMRRIEPVLPCMAYGKQPDAGQRRLLVRAGVMLALWDGYDPGVLRFQINRMVSRERQASTRTTRRAPVHAPVRVTVGGRKKDGILYSLSEGGCFIESPRASMDGAQLNLGFEIEDHEFELDGVVVFANVPGNLQRPNLPLGMGVRFEDVPKQVLNSLARFIRERMNSLEV